MLRSFGFRCLDLLELAPENTFSDASQKRHCPGGSLMPAPKLKAIVDHGPPTLFRGLELSPAEVVALSKVKAGPARDQLAAGQHPVDFRVHVAGSIYVGVDFEQSPRLTQEDLLRVLASACLHLKRGAHLSLVVARAFAPATPEPDLEGLKAQLAGWILPGRPSTTSRGPVRADGLTFTRLA